MPASDPFVAHVVPGGPMRPPLRPATPPNRAGCRTTYSSARQAPWENPPSRILVRSMPADSTCATRSPTTPSADDSHGSFDAIGAMNRFGYHVFPAACGASHATPSPRKACASSRMLSAPRTPAMQQNADGSRAIERHASLEHLGALVRSAGHRLHRHQNAPTCTGHTGAVIGFSCDSISPRCRSSHGGSISACPSVSTGSSEVKPGPSVASSTMWPSGSLV